VLAIADSELSIPRATPPPSASRTPALLAGIGPTTSNHLTSSGYAVSVTSPKPDADSLAAALLLYAVTTVPLDSGTLRQFNNTNILF